MTWPTRGYGKVRVHAALPSHGRGHRFETCHAHQHKRLLGIPLRRQLPADCQQTWIVVARVLSALPCFGSLRTSMSLGKNPPVQGEVGFEAASMRLRGWGCGREGAGTCNCPYPSCPLVPVDVRADSRCGTDPARTSSRHDHEVGTATRLTSLAG